MNNLCKIFMQENFEKSIEYFMYNSIDHIQRVMQRLKAHEVNVSMKYEMYEI